MGRRVFGLMAVLSSLAGASLETIVKSYFELQSQGACAAWVDLFAADFVVTDPHGTAAITDIGVLREACESSNVPCARRRSRHGRSRRWRSRRSLSPRWT